MSSSKSFTQEDLKHIADQINAELDIPWVPESVEQYWIEWLLAKILMVVPPEVIQFMADASDGLSPEEIAKYESVITDMANSLIDIPYIPEGVEAGLIRPIVRQLLQFAVSGKALSFQAPESAAAE